jgi:hypothetical protein
MSFVAEITPELTGHALPSKGNPAVTRLLLIP